MTPLRAGHIDPGKGPAIDSHQEPELQAIICIWQQYTAGNLGISSGKRARKYGIKLGKLFP